MDRGGGIHSRGCRHRGEAPGLGVRTQTAHGGRPGCGPCRDHHHPAQPQHTAPRPSSLSPPLPGNAVGAKSQQEKEHPISRCFPPQALCLARRHTSHPRNQLIG